VAALHKLITGGEQWLAFAKSKLQTLVSLGLEYASQHFTMPDGADVQVRIASAQHFIRIDGGASYEFFTSEPIFPSTASTGEYTGGESSFGVTGSSIRSGRAVAQRAVFHLSDPARTAKMGAARQGLLV